MWYSGAYILPQIPINFCIIADVFGFFHTFLKNFSHLRNYFFAAPRKKWKKVEVKWPLIKSKCNYRQKCFWLCISPVFFGSVSFNSLSSVFVVLFICIFCRKKSKTKNQSLRFRNQKTGRQRWNWFSFVCNCLYIAFRGFISDFCFITEAIMLFVRFWKKMNNLLESTLKRPTFRKTVFCFL